MSLHPDLSKLHRIASPELWRDRAVVWTGAVVTGLCVVGFVQLVDLANGISSTLFHEHPWLSLLVLPGGGMLVVWLTQRFAPGAEGSGIPQVIAALNSDLSENASRAFVSLRLSIAKAFLGVFAILCGFSVGREGPSVQIASGVLLSFHGLVQRRFSIDRRDLILAGGAAGIAAAFNAPLAGVMFAIEELGKRFEAHSSGVLVTAIILAGLVAVAIMGNLNYFGRLHIDNVPLALFMPALVVAVVSGITGGLLSRLLINSVGKHSWLPNRWRARHPVFFAGACGALVALLGLATGGAIFGSGHTWTSALLAGEGQAAPGYFVAKSLATWLSYWSGIPGGIFAPALSIGAGIGHDISLLMDGVPATALIALGMASFLAAMTQAPITSFIIVMEMTDGHSMVLSLMAAAFGASMISRLISAPLYPSLASIQLQRLRTIS